MSPRVSFLAALATLAIAPAAGATVVVFSSTSCAQGGTEQGPNPSPAGDPTADNCVASLWTANSDGTDPRRLTQGEGGGDTDPSWSPDGKTIAYAHGIATHLGFLTSIQRIWLMNADGGDAHPLTSGGNYAADVAPRFSPDGRRIAYESSRVYDQISDGVGGAYGATSVFTMAADGTDDVQVTPDGMTASAPIWSPDGSRLYFSVAEGDPRLNQWGSDLGMVSTTPTGGDPQPVVVGPSISAPQFSPDGHFVAFNTDRWNAFVADMATGAPTLVTPSYVMPSGWDLLRPATLIVFGDHYSGATGQFEDDYAVDLTSPQPQHVPIPRRTVVYVPRPTGDVQSVPYGILPPMIVADSEVGTPAGFPGGPLPPDPWYAEGSTSRQGPPTSPPSPPANPRDELRFDTVAPGGLAVVRVSLGWRLRHGRCRFLGRTGRLGSGDACTAVHLVSAGSAAHWAKVVADLPRGTYVVRFQAVDRGHRRSKMRARPLVITI